MDSVMLQVVGGDCFTTAEMGAIKSSRDGDHFWHVFIQQWKDYGWWRYLFFAGARCDVRKRRRR